MNSHGSHQQVSEIDAWEKGPADKSIQLILLINHLQVEAEMRQCVLAFEKVEIAPVKAYEEDKEPGKERRGFEELLVFKH